MTLTSPMCPVAESLPPEVESKIRAIPEVAAAKVEVVWDPPWSMEKMSEGRQAPAGNALARRSLPEVPPTLQPKVPSNHLCYI